MATTHIKIGVLALQGAFELHKPHIEACGAHYVPVVNADDFNNIDALILPGGESAVMLKLIDVVGIKNILSTFTKTKPVWGICAGSILMAHSVKNPEQFCFDVLDVDIERNAYGRQIDSFNDVVNGYEVSFIRAPKMTRVGKNVNVLSTQNNDPTWVQCGKAMATTFHPETNLNFPSPWHKSLIKVLE